MTCMLAGVGVSATQERLYVLLLDHPGLTQPAISRASGMSLGAAEQTIADLLAMGLLTEEPGPVLRYWPVAPDVAIEALVAQQQEELARARVAASVLRERVRQAAAQRHDDHINTVETVRGGAAAAQRLWQSQVAAERDVLAIGMPAAGRPADDREPVALSCLRRGVRYRALYSRAALADPGAAHAIRACVAAGGQARVAEPPVQLLLVDGRVAVLPQYLDHGLSSAVVTRSAPVVAALSALAEVAWAQAAPMAFISDGPAIPANSASADVAHLVPLLAAGCKDETIARQLGVSTRTLDRRVRVLMDELGAVTRFQAGWLAAGRYVEASGRER
ncbi:MAG: hypothetical protein GEV04_15795 [Actinophytocola sp.]|nr:hypothetical protein [Actinophytocola sp.]